MVDADAITSARPGGFARSAGMLLLVGAAASAAGVLLRTAPAHGAVTLPSFLLAAQDGTARFLGGQPAAAVALYFACFGVYVFAAAVFMIYWRWMGRDPRMLAVGLLSLLMAAHTAAISGTLPFVFPSFVDAETARSAETISYLLLHGVVALLLWSFFPDAFRPPATTRTATLNSGVGAAAVLVSVGLAAASLAVETSAPLVGVARGLSLAVMALAAGLAVRTVRSRSPFGALTAAGLALLIAGSAHDVLFSDVGGGGRPSLTTFAVLGFVLIQSYVVLRRSAESTHMARISSRRLRREVELRTRELRAATVAAQSANAAKTEFVTAVTHELRTPLASLLGYVDLIREEVRDELDPEHRAFFDNLEMSAERLLDLVNNLLDLAKIESGRIDVTLEDVDAAAVAEEVRRQVYPIALEKHLYLEVDVRTDRTHIITDPHWIHVVLTNLVSNAVKYTDEGGVTIVLESSRLGDRPALCIRVVDTGPGISPDFMPRLFHRFAREERIREDVPNGSGLGLTIAKELLDRLGGEISVESKVGKGSTFAIRLPEEGLARDV